MQGILGVRSASSVSPMQYANPRRSASPSLSRCSNVTKLVLFALVSFTVLSCFLFWNSTNHADGLTSDTALNKGGSVVKKSSGGSILHRQETISPTDPPMSPEGLVRDFFAGAPPVTCPERVFSAKELAGHAVEADLLIVVHGHVLNVTNFWKSHPGGRAIFDGANGNDAAAPFTHYHQPSTVALFRNFCIGRLANKGGG